MFQFASAFALIFGLTACNGYFNRTAAVDATSSSTVTQTFANSLELPPGMARASAVDTIAKLVEIFPNGFVTLTTRAEGIFGMLNDPSTLSFMENAANTEGTYLTPIVDQSGAWALSVYGTRSILATAFRSLGQPDRTESALVQMATRVVFEDICSTTPGTAQNITNLGPPQTTLFTDTFSDGSSILLPGESLPSDPATRIAFEVARQAWRYPYLASDPEVQHLKQLYTNPIFNSELDRRSALCKVALLSSQFWEGNPFKDDVLRRLALPLARRSATFSEIAAYRSGSLSVTQYTAKLQTEPKYMSSVLRWHAEQFGLRGFVEDAYYHIVLPKKFTGLNPFKGQSFGFGGQNVRLNDQSYGPHIMDFTDDGIELPNWEDGCVMPRTVGDAGILNQNTNTYSGQNPAYVNSDPFPNFNTPFDPRTTALVWEQYNPNVSRYEILGAWVLNDTHFIGQYRDALDAALPGQGIAGLSDAQILAQYCTTSGVLDTNPNDSRWLKCQGRYTASAANGDDQNGLIVTHLEDVTSPAGLIDANGSGFTRSAMVVPQYTINASGQTVQNALHGINKCANADGWASMISQVIPQSAHNMCIAQLYPITGPGYYYRALRRVVRYSPKTTQNLTGRNTDFSSVELFATGGKVQACNSISRYLATCAYQARGNAPVSFNNFNWDGPSQAVGTAQWNAAVAKPFFNFIEQNGFGTGRDSKIVYTFAHPDILNSFRCGVVNQNTLANVSSLAQSDSSDFRSAIPFGYEDLPTDPAQGIPASWTQNQASQNLSTLLALTPVTPQTGRIVPEIIWYNNNVHYPSEAYSHYYYGTDALAQEANIHTYTVEGLSDEPINFINYIITNNLDYSDLTTANYTVINKAVELFYRNNSQPQSIRPAGYVPPGENSVNGLAQKLVLDFSTLQRMPLRMTDEAGGLAAPTGWKQIYRPKAGLLSMPALMSPMQDSGPRGFSQRVFKRFLCTEANIYDPTSSAYALQSNYYASNFANASWDSGSRTAAANFVQNHIRPDCASCHSNLDPLGMALFTQYGGWIGYNYKIGDLYNNPALGYRFEVSNGIGGAIGVVGNNAPDAIGHGLFLNQEVQGFAGVGQAVANSSLFYSCAAQTAFQNMFGRLPSSAEAQVRMKNAIDHFQSQKKYNLMIQELAEIQEKLGGQ